MLFSKELENLSGEDSRNDDGSRGDLSTASDDVNANNTTVSTTLELFFNPRLASFNPQEALLPWSALCHYICLLFFVACSVSLHTLQQSLSAQGYILCHCYLLVLEVSG